MKYTVCYMILRNGLCLLLCCFCNTIHAQDSMDSNYVRRFTKHITTRVFIGEKISFFSLEDNQHNKQLRYRPNNILAIGLGTTIKGIGFNFSTRLPLHETKENLYGRTRRYDLQAHRYRAKLMLDVYAQRYKGFHLNNLDHVDSVIGEQQYPYLPELTTVTVGASGMYVFNGNRFSMKGGVNQQDWQIRSAGSFMAGGSLFARYIYNNGSILPPYLKYPEFYDASQPQHISSYGLTMKVGYGYNYVHRKHYFVGASFDVGAGPGYSMVRDVNDHTISGFGLNMSANMRFTAGYNSEKWFGGIYAIFQTDRYSLPYAKSMLWTGQGIFRIVAARRFTYKKLPLGL